MDATTTHQQAGRETAAYLALTFALTLAIAVGLPDAGINVLLSVFVPVTAVGVLTFMTPRGSRRAMWRSIGLGRAGLRSWPAALLIPVALCGAAYGVALAVGAGDLADISVSGKDAVSLTIGLAVGSVLFLGEEIGWRGYLLPRMQQLTGPRRGAVLTGFAHGCFHLPLILLATTYDTEGSRWYAAPAAVLTITAGGVFYAWLHDRSGTVWPVAIGHNAVNKVFDLGAAGVVTATPGSLAYVAGETGLATMGAATLLAVVLLRRSTVWGRPTRDVGEPARELAAPARP